MISYTGDRTLPSRLTDAVCVLRALVVQRFSAWWLSRFVQQLLRRSSLGKLPLGGWTGRPPKCYAQCGGRHVSAGDAGLGVYGNFVGQFVKVVALGWREIELYRDTVLGQCSAAGGAVVGVGQRDPGGFQDLLGPVLACPDDQLAVGGPLRTGE
jgi:hypothetical protein